MVGVASLSEEGAGFRRGEMEPLYGAEGKGS